MPVADTAAAIGTAMGATVDVQDGFPGPTIIGLAETAAGAGSAGSGRCHVVARAGSATGSGGVGSAQVSSISAFRRVHAARPRPVSAAHPGTLRQRPAVINS